MNKIKLINDLYKLGERQGKGANKALSIIANELKKGGISSYKTNSYRNIMPVWSNCSLRIDGKNLKCLPTGFSSGIIETNNHLTTSLVSSRLFFEIPHINFNPRCNGISKANFSDAPSIAVSKNDIEKILKAKDVLGKVSVKKVRTQTKQLLVGNLDRPKSIIFSHYDSVMNGAIDNASGTAVILDIILSNQGVLKDNLFVFDGNEEISFDKPIYWGKGYRNFEKKYSNLIKNCKKMIVVDCVGGSKTLLTKDKRIIKLAFPIKGAETYYRKIILITSDYDELMNVYHSELDKPKLIKQEFLTEAYNIALREIINCK